MLGRVPQSWQPWHLDIAGTSLFLLLAGLAWWCEIGPLVERYGERDRSTAQLAEQGARQRELDAQLKRVREATVALKDTSAAKNLVLEPRTRLNDHLSIIYNLASDCGLLPDAVEPQNETVHPIFSRVNLRLSGRGTYLNCMQFLERLRAQSPHDQVASIELSASPSAAEPMVNFNIQLVWHAMPAALASN